jgi:hypothetical protein
MKKIYWVSFFVLAFQNLQNLGCAARKFNSKSNEAVRAEIAAEGKSIQIKLSKVKNIPFNATEHLPEQKFDLPNSLQKVVKVRFGKLEPKQFEFLKKQYGAPETQTFEPDHFYELQDFMPKIVQATIHHRMIERTISFKTENSGSEICKALIASNCWGTAYEYLRNNSAGLDIFQTSRTEFARFLFEKGKEQKDEGLSFFKKDKQNEVKLVAIFNRVLGNKLNAENSHLQHVAVEVDEGFYFEKTGLVGSYLYRFITQDTLLEMYPKNKFEHKVFIFSSEQTFPEAALEFAKETKNISERIKECGQGESALVKVPYEQISTSGRVGLLGAISKGGAYTKEFYLP